MPEPPARAEREGIARKPPHRLPVRAVLFDLDGTLADTAADLGDALNRVRADRALPPLPLAVLRPQASHGARGLLAAGFGIGKEHADFASLRDAFLAYYAEALCEHTTLFPGADRVLAEIERRGLRWGIVTNKAARFTVPVVERLALAARAGAVICGDTTRAEQAASGAAARAAQRRSASTPAAMRLCRRRRARHHRRTRRRHAYAVRRVRLRRRRRNAGGVECRRRARLARRSCSTGFRSQWTSGGVGSTPLASCSRRDQPGHDPAFR